MSMRKAAWPYIRKATDRDLVQWAFLCALDALQIVCEHGKVSEVERDWLIDFLVPVGRAGDGYEEARAAAEQMLQSGRRPLKRFRPLAEAMTLDGILPGQVVEEALSVVELSHQMIDATCKAMLANEYQLSVLNKLARLVAGEELRATQLARAEPAPLEELADAEDEGFEDEDGPAERGWR